MHTRHAMADCVEFSGVLEENYEIQLVTVSSHMEAESSKYVYTTDREMYNSWQLFPQCLHTMDYSTTPGNVYTLYDLLCVWW